MNLKSSLTQQKKTFQSKDSKPFASQLYLDIWFFLFIFFGPPTLAWSVLWNSGCLSFHLSFHLSRCFLGTVSLVSSKFWHDARNPYQVLCGSWIFQKKNFCLKNWGNGTKMGQKQDFLNILKNFVANFYWTCSIMKIYIICCVPEQIPYLGKFWFLRYGPKCSQPIRIFWSTISPEQINEMAWFFACWYKFT